MQTEKPDVFYARLTELAATGEAGGVDEVTSPDDNLQAVFQYLGEVIETDKSRTREWQATGAEAHASTKQADEDAVADDGVIARVRRVARRDAVVAAHRLPRR